MYSYGCVSQKQSINIDLKFVEDIDPGDVCRVNHAASGTKSSLIKPSCSLTVSHLHSRTRTYPLSFLINMFNLSQIHD